MQSPRLKNQFVAARQIVCSSVEGRDTQALVNRNAQKLIKSIHRQGLNELNKGVVQQNFGAQGRLGTIQPRGVPMVLPDINEEYGGPRGDTSGQRSRQPSGLAAPQGLTIVSHSREESQQRK